MKKQNKVKCEVCGGLYSKSNIKKHKQSCNGTIKNKKKINHCKFCGISLFSFTNSEKANHIRWCYKNPKREQYSEKARENLKKLIKSGSIDYKNISKKIKKLHKEGVYDLAISQNKEHPYWLGKNIQMKQKTK